MRELDALLTGYLEVHYDRVSDEEKAAFRTFLTLSDPELVAYLLQRQQAASEPIARVVDHILGRTSS